MSNVRIRDLAPTDLASAYEINQGEVPAVGDATPEHFADLAAMSAIAVVAEADHPAEHTDTPAWPSTVVGFTFVFAPGSSYDSGNYLWFSERYDDFVYLDRIAISPRFQRQGIGRMLYQDVIERAAIVRPSAPVLTLEVNLEPRNDVSLAFHAALGFEEVGQRETAYGTTVSLMALPLNSGQPTS